MANCNLCWTAPFTKASCSLRLQRVYSEAMSVAEIKIAITHLSPVELAEVSEFIRQTEASLWDSQIESDFGPGGRHHGLLKEIDAQIDAGNFTPISGNE